VRKDRLMFAHCGLAQAMSVHEMLYIRDAYIGISIKCSHFQVLIDAYGFVSDLQFA